MDDERVRIPVREIEFDRHGTTLWVQSVMGTVLRIKSIRGFATEKCRHSPVSHSDLIVTGPIPFCLAGDVDQEDSVDSVVAAAKKLREAASTFLDTSDDAVEVLDPELKHEHESNAEALAEALAKFDAAVSPQPVGSNDG